PLRIIGGPSPPPTSANMSASNPKSESEYKQIAAKFAAAKALIERENAPVIEVNRERDAKIQTKRRNKIAQRKFTYTHGLVVALLLAFFYLHAVGIFLFTRGFLL